jgi:hypothetical protein
LHPAAIKLGFIGTRETIAGAKEWIDECSGFVESENIERIKGPDGDDLPLLPAADQKVAEQVRLHKILNRDFVGLSADSPFECSFQVNERWQRVIRPEEIDAILTESDKTQRILRLVALFESHVQNLATTGPSPDVIILALTKEILDQAHAVQITGNFYLNFRRAIKAKVMKWGIPIQLIRRETVLGTGTRLQERATRAWNLSTALYYKADGVPWRPTTLEPDTCFVGIDFYVSCDVNERLTMRSSVAQAFDYLSQGLILRGDPFEWDETAQGRSPHMTREGARTLIRSSLGEYVKVRGTTPRRVVIHKSSQFWGHDHEPYNELDGLREGIREVFPSCETDFLALRHSGIRLFREGKYPPARGTYFCLGGKRHFLYTMGFVPYLETYPGSFVPEPYEIVDHHGGSSPKELFREVLALTKMNVNNCSFSDGIPITLAFSHKIGEIMKHIAAGDAVETRYKFYM